MGEAKADPLSGQQSLKGEGRQIHFLRGLRVKIIRNIRVLETEMQNMDSDIPAADDPGGPCLHKDQNEQAPDLKELAGVLNGASPGSTTGMRTDPGGCPQQRVGFVHPSAQ